MSDVLRTYDVSAIDHFAAKERADESAQRPLWYYSKYVNLVINVLT